MNCPVGAVCAVPTTPFLLPRIQRLMLAACRENNRVCAQQGSNVACAVLTAVVNELIMLQDRVECSSTQMAEVAQLAEEETRNSHRTTRVVGWYHSHPHITALPSHVDVQTQARPSPAVGASPFACFSNIYAWRIHQAPLDPFNEHALICRPATRLSMKALLASSCHASTACKLLSRETGYRYEPLTDKTQLWFLCPILIDFGTPTCPLSLPLAQQSRFVTTLQLIQEPLSRTCAHVTCR